MGTPKSLPMKKVISEYESGMTLQALAEKYSRSVSYIYTRLKKAGVQTRGRKKSLPVAQIISDYESGMNLEALAEKYKVSISTIKNRLSEAGTQTRKQGSRIASSVEVDRNNKISEAYHQQGKSLGKVGDEFGLSRERVRLILNKMGVGTRGKRRAKTDLNEAELEELKVMFKEGFTYKSMAIHFKVKSEVISQAIKREGLVKPYVPNVSWDYKKAEEDYLSGVPLTEIARRRGVASYNAIGPVMERLGHERRGTKSERSKGLPVDQIISEYESGKPIYQLGEEYGVSRETIRRRLVKAGVHIRTSSKALPVSEIWFEYESGMTQTQLAKKYGVNVKTIKSRLNKINEELS